MFLLKTNILNFIFLDNSNLVIRTCNLKTDHDEVRRKHCLFLKLQVNNCNIIVIYKSPKYSLLKFRENLEDMLKYSTENTFYVGDININLQEKKNLTIPDLFKKYGFKSCLDLKHPSTDFGTHIDVCFTNNQQIQAWFYESYYSYHKGICIICPKDI